jgi:dihydroorotase-like cyclic amidohydrolase
MIENGVITAIGPNLAGDKSLDATGCFVMPGGIDPHTHLEMPFMGTYSADDFESGTRAALSGGTTMVIDFALPSPGQSLLEALTMWDNKSTRANCDYSFHMAITWWGEQVFNEMEAVVRRSRHQHLQALHGLQGRADGGRRRDVLLVPAHRRTGRACRWSMPRTATWWRNCSRN